MKLFVTKTWITEEEVEAPDDLSPDELKKWIEEFVSDWADITYTPTGNSTPPQWQSTEVHDEQDKELFEAST